MRQTAERKVLTTSRNPVSTMICYQLTDKQYLECQRAAEAVTQRRARFSKGKGGDWHAGAFSKPSISTRVGFCGELAFYEILSTWFKSLPRYELQVKKKVDKCDYKWTTPLGSRHEVKTTVASPDGEYNYIRQQAVEDSEVFWFMSTQDTESRDYYLRGYVTAEQLKDRATLKKGRGDWHNYLMLTEDLEKLSTFLDLRARRKDESTSTTTSHSTA